MNPTQNLILGAAKGDELAKEESELRFFFCLQDHYLIVGMPRA